MPKHLNKPRRVLTFIIATTTIIFSCSNSRHGFGDRGGVSSNSTDIIPFVGVGNLVLAESNIRDVQRAFGKGKKKWDYVSIFDLGEFYFERTIEYPDLGMTISTDRLYHSAKFAISSIEMNSSCRFKTKMGNGIGSTLNDLRREFGSIQVTHWTTTEGKYQEAFVTNNWVSCIAFKCYSSDDTADFMVENIRMDFLQ